MKINIFKETLLEADYIDKNKNNFIQDYGDVDAPSKDIEFLGTFNDADILNLYGDNSVVIRFEANIMKWHDKRKDVDFYHGVKTFNVTDILVDGKAVLSKNNGDHIVEDWDGEELSPSDLSEVAQHSINHEKEQGREDLYQLYVKLLQSKPNFWIDFVKAIRLKFDELDKAVERD